MRNTWSVDGVRCTQKDYIKSIEGKLSKFGLVVKYFSEQGNQAERDIVKNLMGE